mmetsp:Transcript_13398/g.15038  ORF Transcript_13398/g.15038 Transcript_13398/m.15038 type:complete len:775 (+) Transcript_13398:31-2355(+)|eukprot:CAMPEP_0205823006 /NCGR_PEP_ID=MMETSP0206-20130828/14615_1 /ASSEMBLY_ACC=CAM_ASM_000279 /TAXON_ID=36767 /ORGANISM="Euplotes focardii, Strain TN1" /LENGTH=774 /DNA_ID=CAMNT_0053119765 /DNA_START=34 /DNA_END=2358 /DNA_ORIENTATION=+
MSKHEMKQEASGRPTKRAKASKKEYLWSDLHADMEEGKYAGVYGGCNSPWFGLAEIRAGVNMLDWHGKRAADEVYIKEVQEYLERPSTQERWNDVVTFDPQGMFAKTPTMSSCEAHLNLPELNLRPDGVIVNEDGSVNIQKIAVDYCWNLPGFSERLGFQEDDVRKHLYKWSNNPTVLDEKLRAYLPPLGGFTVYIFGDIRKLSNPATQLAVRVHDSCCGSDVFGTDICTCRPYLVFSVEAAVDCAQKGGVGLVVYFQKEGRSLGEVTKYRVYNARKAQEGGDRAEKYFFQTESIAGIRDARFQEAMPDVLLWLGVKRIDFLLSMSSEKYDAITDRGIKVMQRVSLPDRWVPAHAQVEITAKISAGYHTDTIASDEIISELRNLEMVRSRCNQIFALAEKDEAVHFKLDMTKLPQVAEFVAKMCKDNYPNLNIPYHSRWRHFNEAALEKVIDEWKCDDQEKVRRQLDMCFVSVLLDAGAGDKWRYLDSDQKEVTRSEGLAVASMDMFLNGLFSSDVAQPHRVNSHGLRQLSSKKLHQGFQVGPKNPMVGLEGRYGLLQRLANALDQSPQFFGYEICRPGNVLDYVLKHVTANRVSVRVLWKAVIEGLEQIWPENTAGVRRGDVWVYNPLKEVGVAGSDMVPFHKLSQWLTYSLLEPIESLGIEFDDLNLLTGLAEYRNGGLFVDFEVLTTKVAIGEDMSFDAGSELVVEWRALTVSLVDRLAPLVRDILGQTEQQMGLAKILQGGTWAAGRAIALKKRPDRSSPIKISSDGTVF